MTLLKDTLTAVLRGETIDWSRFSCPTDQIDLEEEAIREGVACLLANHLRQRPDGVPAKLLDDLGRLARQEALRERVSQMELTRVVATMEDARIPGLLMKGTPLAYTHYARPWLRPRSDVDLLVAASHVGRAKSLLLEMGYQSPPELPGGTLTNELTFGRNHERARDIDLHWKTSHRPIFSDVISFDTLMEGSVPVASLNPSARSPKPLHSLLIACMHRVKHQNSDKLLWLYDIHLIAERLSAIETEEFIEIAKRKRIWTICARSVELSAAHFRSSIPDRLRAELKSAEPDETTEPSASYLNNGPWHTRVTDIRTLPNWRERVHAVQEMAFPRRSYVRELYREHPVTPLPLLYLHRLARGAVRMFRPTQL